MAVKTGVNLQRIVRGIARRWLNLRNNHRLRRLAGEVLRHTPAPSAAPVVFFNASTRLEGLSLNAAFSLLSAWSLRLSGAPVVHFVCSRGLSRCVLGTDREQPHNPPPCSACLAQSRAMYAGGDVRWFAYHRDERLAAMLMGLDVLSLSALVYDGLPLGELCLPSLRWILRCHHLADDENTRFLYREYVLSARCVAQEFLRLLDEVQPQAAVVFNGMFYPEAVARYVAMQRGLRVITHEVGLHPFTAYFTPGEATAYPIDIPTEFDLDERQSRQLDEYLSQRFQGNFSMAGVRFWPQMQPLSAQFWQRASGFKQIVPIFTNVVFDTSQGHANQVFPHMFAWLDMLLQIIRAHPETFFVIRAHPDECRPGKESRESVAQWAERHQVRLLPNVLYVDADEYFSSYELIQHAHFVMVYNSTIGLEASIMGRPVLCGGKARFTQLPTVFFPATPEAYLQQAEEFLSASQIETPPEFQRNARRFLYYQIFRTSLPFNDLLEEDPFWRGYVHLKPIGWQSLLPQNSPALGVIVNGILKGEPFLL
ncbi:MAG: hypothetical protein HPY45_11130 [Anaerolineae bacterium]|nr:hypothetical protein [Anaerolineae bacterium]